MFSVMVFELSIDPYSLRRVYLDHAVVLNENHLRGMVRTFLNYYPGARTHLALDKNALAPRLSAAHGTIR
jgi:hypothetical protein